ncbi:hypothetical protein J4H92_06650 [Leucobacter weissii]|uniref:Uncharacterized protein n=1 Tax=Leucobacter weissii TaxID=1983706 RepID=A0A939SBP0_9MICO|nr:hypothetical protein [Leucobacter weissii]MBO1901630.1 hypothetical protein [Leucobacter weissii]
MSEAAPPPPAPQAPQTQAPTAAPAPQQPDQQPAQKLSPFLKISIILLSALSIASISLLFIGDFEGKFERVFATFVVFAVFVLLTAFDTRRDLRSSWYAPVALIANSYILTLSLVVTWMTAYDYFLSWHIFWKCVFVILVVRAVILCCQLLLATGEGRPELLGRFAFVTSVLAVVSGILFTAPVAIETFDITVPELYWRIAVASLLLTALGLAITLLLRWYYGSADREASRLERQAAASQAPAPVQPGGAGAQPAPQTWPSPSPSPSPSAERQPTQQPGADAHGLLPWPRYPDGRPLPAGPDGQPDFGVPGAPLPPR